MCENICGSVLSHCKSEFAPICHNVTEDWPVKWITLIISLQDTAPFGNHGPFIWMPLDMHHQCKHHWRPSKPPPMATALLDGSWPPSRTMCPAKLTTNISVLVQGPWQRAKAVNMAAEFPRSQSDWASARASPIRGGPISRPNGLKVYASNTLVPDTREHPQL